MKDTKLKFFKELLLEERNKMVSLASEHSREEDEKSSETTPDELDQAASISTHFISSRLRGRESKLIAKIDKALSRIGDGSYGVCNKCGDDIGLSRLKARPVATLCISCKKEQERLERQSYYNG